MSSSGPFKRSKRPDRSEYQAIEEGRGSFPPATLSRRIAFPKPNNQGVPTSDDQAEEDARIPTNVRASTTSSRAGTGSGVGLNATAVLNRGSTKARPAFRTSKTSQKLALFPDEFEKDRANSPAMGGTGADGNKEDVYNQLNQMAEDPHFTGRVNAELWRRLKRDTLPRVSAYCTATSYDLKAAFRYLQSRRDSRQAAPILMDECLYSPFSFRQPVGGRRASMTDGHGHDGKATDDHLRNGRSHAKNVEDMSASVPHESNGHDLLTLSAGTPELVDDNVAAGIDYFDQIKDQLTSEIFIFDYGVVVLWAMTADEEKRALAELRMCEVEPLDLSDHQTEEFNLYYNPQYPPMIYNDVIRLRKPKNHMVKLAISHAIAQSVKLTLYEELVEETINDTKHIPQIMAATGRVKMSRTAITKKIGQLFIMRINVNLVSNILDTPEIFWSEPALQPLYDAIRGYLEISQRAEIMNHRVGVISDLLDMLREHLNGYHGEFLEWIVIILIGIEICIGLITISLEAKNLRARE